MTDHGEKAWSINREPTNRNRIEGAAEHEERAACCEVLVIEVKWRRSGGCAVKECELYWGLCLKGRRREAEREVSRGRSSEEARETGWSEGPNEKESRTNHDA